MATLHVIPSNLHDLPAQLRAIADELEAGKYGHVQEGALTLLGSRLHVFGLGSADSTGTHYLLACAQAKLQAPMLEHGR